MCTSIPGALLLDDVAPRTSKAVWDALPQSSQVFHGKYARNEIDNLFPAFDPKEPGAENTAVSPIPGDVCQFTFTSNDLKTASHGNEAHSDTGEVHTIVDLAVFYGRSNLLLNGDTGWVPGNVFARDETLTFSR
ncbi:DUF3830 family protein [Arthrobacter sp. TB 23]|uniref:DUF3830 family protein n=1 Tax=Arthrobacter sp. TB 23 TaxID=494419 RepID=UPI0009FBA44C